MLLSRLTTVLLTLDSNHPIQVKRDLMRRKVNTYPSTHCPKLPTCPCVVLTASPAARSATSSQLPVLTFGLRVAYTRITM